MISLNKPWYRPQKPQFFHHKLRGPCATQPHTPPCYSLRFTHVFYFMLLLIQVFPAPISAVTKEAVSNQWAQSWETGASPAYPFDPPGTGLPSGTWSLKTLSRPASKSKWELACLTSQRLEGKHWCCLRWGSKGDRQESLTEDYWEKESRVDVLFSLWNYRIKTGHRGKAAGGCGLSRREQTCILSCVCPLGSVTHSSPWLNWKACVQRTGSRVRTAGQKPQGPALLWKVAVIVRVPFSLPASDTLSSLPGTRCWPGTAGFSWCLAMDGGWNIKPSNQGMRKEKKI